MFAFAGASTFPTIQADMKNRSHFNYAAVIAILSKYRVSHETWQLVNGFECLSPYTLLVVKDFCSLFR